MSEQMLTPEQALAADIRTALAEPMADLEQVVYQSGLRPIVEGVFAHNPLLDNYDCLDGRMQRAFITGEVDDPQATLNRTEVSAYVVEISGNMINSMFRAYPEMESDDDSSLKSLLKPFRQGHDKLLKVMVTENPELEGVRAAEYLTPYVLANLAGYEAEFLEDENAEAAQRRLQAAAENIVNGGSITVHKKMSPDEEIFARTMNMLGILYHRGSDIDFYSRYILHAYDTVMRTNPDFKIDPLKTTDEDVDLIRRTVPAMVQRDAESFGITADVSRVMNEYFDSDAWTKSHKLSGKDLMTAVDSNTVSHDQMKTIAQKENQRLSDKREDVIIESQRVLVARHMVDLMAAGAFDPRALLQFAELAGRQPLKEIAADVPVPEQLVEWEIAPPAIGEGDSHTCEAKSEPNGLASGWDMARKDQMEEYVRTWGEEMGQNFGQGRVARSRIPKLKESEQYYVAILPQMVGGIVIEHAIADNPMLGRHAVYVWRAENGIGRFGQVQQNWETVFSQNKRIMKLLGARRMLHSLTLENKVLDYLTRPEDKLRDPRYYY